MPTLGGCIHEATGRWIGTSTLRVLTSLTRRPQMAGVSRNQGSIETPVSEGVQVSSVNSGKALVGEIAEFRFEPAKKGLGI